MQQKYLDKLFGCIIFSPGNDIYHLTHTAKKSTHHQKENAMNNKEILSQMVKFNKTIFDNAFKAMQMAQDQGEKLITSMVDQATWLPEDGRKTITNWVQAYQKGVKEFKNHVDQQYQKVEEYLDK
jgi:predicted glycosyltransferase involved in capsule biosynthesis